MDTELSKEVLQERKRKNILLILAVIAVILVCIWLLRGFLKSTVERSKITTAQVEIGSVENTLSASGEVLPEFEEILTSPINASIKKALMDAGNKVKTGQSIITLDKSSSQNDYVISSNSSSNQNKTILAN